MARGRLRVYLGAAPGVGKTHAMLDEAQRRAGRGTDVVIGLVDSADREGIESMLRGLERVPATLIGELDVDAVLARRPAVVLVDDLAHRPDTVDAPARWVAVETLLAADIEVITTVGITNLESLQDVVAEITGVPPDETVPDHVVRGADQIELVDMTPEALRRRLAHGHVYPPERVDAALANLFRPAVLGALRQLALLWMAERVEEQLQRDRGGHAAGDVRERVVVALGGEGGDHLVRRAARLAGRSGGQLIGVHVVRAGQPAGPDLEHQRQLLIELGGVYREVVGDDVGAALAGFVKVEQATQLVIGAQPAARRRRGPSVVDELVRSIGAVDVHVTATTPSTAERHTVTHRRPLRPRQARIAAWLLGLAGLPLLTWVLASQRRHVSVGTALLLDLCIVLGAATLGGLWPGLVASLLAFVLTNWYLTPPLHQLNIGASQNVIALTVFVLVTVVVSVLVDRATRRSLEASQARAEAEALARSAATLVGAHDPLPELLEQVRATFALQSASVLERTPDGWWPTHTSGSPELLSPKEGTSIDLSPDGDLCLVVSQGALHPEQLEVLRAFADQLAMAVQARQLRADAANADLLAEANALRTALLQAVSHDFRTPLSTIRAAATGLLHTDVAFSEEDERALLTEIDDAAARLDRMVRNLLDMSRIQAGAVELDLQPVALEEVVAAAVTAATPSPGRVTVDVPDTLPFVHADAALLERALANLVSNAVAWSPLDRPVRVEAGLVAGAVDLRVIDRGPGVPVADRAAMFQPFQRFGDRSGDAGAGLGLAIANGFVEAMGAKLDVDDTPGGGLTMTIRLPLVDEDTLPVTRILVVDDEHQIRRALDINLRAHGYDVDLAESGEDALTQAAARPADLVLLDLGLPGIDGIDVIRGLRGWSPVPIIVLSAREGDQSKVAALDAGADDYVTKPFSINELLARVRASLRRHQPTPDEPTVETADFLVDLVAKKVMRDGAAVHLTPTEWAIVEELVRHPGRLITQRQLLQRVWGPQYEHETHYLRVYLAAIRRKLEPDPGQPRYFLTEPGIGYRFEPALTRS